jgi:hypothetical protein
MDRPNPRSRLADDVLLGLVSLPGVVRLRFGKGFTLLRAGNSGTSNMGDEPRYMAVRWLVDLKSMVTSLEMKGDKGKRNTFWW